MIPEIRSASAAPSRPAAAPAVPAPAAAPQDMVELAGMPRLEKVLSATASEAASLEKKLDEHVPGQVLVKLKGHNLGKTVDRFAERYGAQVLHKFDIPRNIYQSFEGELLQLQLPAGMTTAEAMAAMGKDPRVGYVVPNHVYHLDEANKPNDLDPRLYGLDNAGQDGGKADADIDAPEAWAISTGRADGPVIAVIDTGADYNHPDLANNVWTNPGETPGDGVDNDGNGVIDDHRGYHAHADNGDPMDGHSHGTHCSGTIAAEGNNGQGVVGVNWRAKLMPVKIFSDGGSTDAAAIVRGILYATKMGARITSNSWGGGPANEAIRDAFAGSPALHVMAAGNSGSDNDTNPHYPSSYDLPNIIAVAATDRNDNLASFSCYGATSVDVGAPGVDILSTVPGGGYGSKSGTSMATPHVAGVAGLIAATYPELSNEQIKARILGGADRIESLQGKVLSGARLNAANALENDSTAPSAPVDFGSIGADSRQVQLRWTSSGDDGWCGGPPSSFELRVSSQPITDETAFAAASLVPTGAPAPTGQFNTATHRVAPSGSERQLHYAMKVRDNVGNTSEMVTAQATVPAASVAFEDNVDASGENWTAEGTWTRVEEAGRGFVWTDSPGGNYGDNANVALTSKPIALAGFRNATLSFDARHALETNFDFIHVEASEDGQSWSELAKIGGAAGWETRTADLSAFDGKNVQVRFRLTSDGSINQDGFYLDNLVVTGDRA